MFKILIIRNAMVIGVKNQKTNRHHPQRGIP